MREEPDTDGGFRDTYRGTHVSVFVWVLILVLFYPVVGLMCTFHPVLNGIIVVLLVIWANFGPPFDLSVAETTTIEVDPAGGTFKKKRQRGREVETWTVPGDDIAEVMISTYSDDNESGPVFGIDIVRRDETAIRTGSTSSDRRQLHGTAADLAAVIGCPWYITEFPLAPIRPMRILKRCGLIALCCLFVFSVTWSLSATIADVWNSRAHFTTLLPLVVFGIPLALLSAAAARTMIFSLVCDSRTWTDPARRLLHVARGWPRSMWRSSHAYDTIREIDRVCFRQETGPPSYGIEILLDGGERIDTGYRSEDPEAALQTAVRLANRIGCPRPAADEETQCDEAGRAGESTVWLTFHDTGSPLFGGLIAAFGCFIGLIFSATGKHFTALPAIVAGIAVLVVGGGILLFLTSGMVTLAVDRDRGVLRVHHRLAWGTTSWECRLDDVRDVVLCTDDTGCQWLHLIELVLDRGTKHDMGLMFFDRPRARACAARIARAIGCPCSSPAA